MPSPLPEVFDDAFERSVLAARLSAEGHLTVVAIDGDRTVGQCLAVVHRKADQAPDLYIDEVGVAPSHRRRGIARALLADAVAWGREQGCETAWLVAGADDAPARALYDAAGWSAEPAVIYELPLTPASDP